MNKIRFWYWYTLEKLTKKPALWMWATHLKLMKKVMDITGYEIDLSEFETDEPVDE